MKLCLILDRLRSAHNTGNIFRIAEALGAEIVACGYTPAPPHPKLAKTAMGSTVNAIKAASRIARNFLPVFFMWFTLFQILLECAFSV